MRARQILERLFEDDFEVQWKDWLRRAAPDESHRAERLLDLAATADRAGGLTSARTARVYRDEAQALLAQLGIETEFRQRPDGSVYPVFTVGAQRMRSPQRAISHAAMLAK
jgi:hypothetical protein